MVYSPLHCLCAELIVKHFEADAHNVVFYIRQGLDTCLNREVWDDLVFHPWPRFNPEPGIFGRARRTESNLKLVASYCKESAQIRLHATVIDTESINYNINYLRAQFPEADFRVRLFPDGTMNIRRHPQGFIREKLKYFRLFRRFLSPDLHYYLFKGDRIGSDDSIVDKIYILHGFPHEYAASKVVELPPFAKSNTEYDRNSIMKRALVVGQPLSVYGDATPLDLKRISDKVFNYLKENGVEDIYYKAHPRDKIRELALSGYKELLIDEPLEIHLSRYPYAIIIGVSSTALLTGKMVLPGWCKAVSCGMNLFASKNQPEAARFTRVLNELGVEVIDA